MTTRWPWLLIAAKSSAGARPGTRKSASCGLPRCCERATCVRDLARCEPPDGRRGCSSALGCEPTSGAVHGSPADRTQEVKKNFCCVTTRRRNLWAVGSLGRQLGPLTARALGLGVLGFDRGSLATLGLPPRCLPAPDLPQAFRFLAVALVPTTRLILAAATFAQANPGARSSPSGHTAVLCLNLAGAHGRTFSQGKARGECASVLLGRLSKRKPDDHSPV